MGDQPTDENMDDTRIPKENDADEIVDRDDDNYYYDDDETPAFINPGDAVEVVVDEENVPMDEDDEEDDPKDETDGAEADRVVAVDMSRIKVEAHTGPVYAVACHQSAPSSDLCIISGGGDDKAFLHRIVAGSTTAAPSVPLEHHHTDSVSSVALNLSYVSEDLTKTPKYAAVGSFDGTIAVYDPEIGKKLQTFEGPSDVEWLVFHPKGGSVILAGSSNDATVWMFHVPLNKCLQVFVGHESSVTCGSFSPDGRWALSGSSDGTVRIWAPRTGASKHVFRLGGGITCMSVGGGSDQQLVMVGAEDGLAHVCHIGTKKVVASLRHYEVPTGAMEDDTVELPMSVEAVGFSTVNPNWCATGGVDGVVKVWDLTTGQCRQVCHADASSGGGDNKATGGITRLQWHPTLPLIFTTATSGSICVWDARSGRLLHTLTGNADVVNDMACCFQENGAAIIVTGGEDHRVRVFEIDSATLMQ